MKQLGPQLTGFQEIWYLSICRESVEKIQVSSKSGKNDGYFTWRPTYNFFKSYLAQFSLKWEVFQTKVVETIKTHILCSVTFFFDNRAVYEIMWKNILESGRAQMTIWRLRIACWIPKATNTNSEYVILIAFPLHQLSQERASTLRWYVRLVLL